MSEPGLSAVAGDITSPPGESTTGPAFYPNIRSEYSGSIGSHNTNSGNVINSGNVTTNNYYNRGGRDSSDSYVQVLRCLYKSAYESHRNRIREPVKGTCNWVTEHPKYRDWLEKRVSSVLWLSADPGCGKSVTASFLVGQLKILKDTMVCYFFFKDDSEEQKSAIFALCAILHQLFVQRKSLDMNIDEEFKVKGKRFTQELDTLWDILVKAGTQGGCGGVICVLDGLDECEDVTLTPLIHHIARLAGSQQTTDSPLKFLVTARPYHKIERQLGSPATTIWLRGEDEINAVTDDVNRVIDEGIKSLELYWGQPGGLGFLRSLLESSADGTFLWVSLVLEVLNDSEDCSEEEFTSVVTTVPRDIVELYTKILDKSRYPDKARRILNIVVAAARPLTLREMSAAFRITREHRSIKDLGDLPAGFDRSMKNWCGLFVRVIDSKVYFIHQTAREFLIKGSSPGRGNWQYTICSKDSNFMLAGICMSYLSLEEFKTDPLLITDSYLGGNSKYDGYLRKYSLLDYAASHWAEHFRDSQTRQIELFQLTQQICEGGSKKFLTWLKVYWKNNVSRYPFPDDFTHLMIATWLGQATVVQQLLREGGHIHARSARYGTALNIAALRKHGDITRMLLRSDVKAYIYGKGYNILQTKRSELRNWRSWLYNDLNEEIIEFLKPFCLPDTHDLHTFPGPGFSFS